MQWEIRAHNTVQENSGRRMGATHQYQSGGRMGVTHQYQSVKSIVAANPRVMGCTHPTEIRISERILLAYPLLPVGGR